MQTNLLDPQLANLDLTPFMREALYEADQAGLAEEESRCHLPSFVFRRLDRIIPIRVLV